MSELIKLNDYSLEKKLMKKCDFIVTKIELYPGICSDINYRRDIQSIWNDIEETFRNMFIQTFVETCRTSSDLYAMCCGILPYVLKYKETFKTVASYLKSEYHIVHTDSNSRLIEHLLKYNTENIPEDLDGCSV